MPGLLTNIDPDGLLEYSVVYTDQITQPHVSIVPKCHERRVDIS